MKVFTKFSFAFVCFAMYSVSILNTVEKMLSSEDVQSPFCNGCSFKHSNTREEK